MRQLEEVFGRCKVDDITACWVWSGAVSGGFPRVYGPDWGCTEERLNARVDAALETSHQHSKIKAAILEALDPVMVSQPGRRAVWQLHTGKAIPAGHRVFGTCLNDQCLNPAHMRCGTGADIGRFTAKVGRFKNQPNRILANRKIGLQRTTLTEELFNEILLSPETGVQIKARTGVSRTIISKVRTGGMMVYRPAGGLFSGLGARNA